MTIVPIPISHPNGGSGYKFIENGKSFVFLTDNELGFRHPGRADGRGVYRTSAKVPTCSSTMPNTPRKNTAHIPEWGHSSYTSALEVALAAGVKRFGLFHLNQDRTDDQMDAIVADCRQRVREAGSATGMFRRGHVTRSSNFNTDASSWKSSSAGPPRPWRPAKMQPHLTGAGISVESGIPPFRGKGGLWEKIDPMEFATIDAFIRDPAKVWTVLVKDMKGVVEAAAPNAAHRGLARLESMGHLEDHHHPKCGRPPSGRRKHRRHRVSRQLCLAALHGLRQQGRNGTVDTVSKSRLAAPAGASTARTASFSVK